MRECPFAAAALRPLVPQTLYDITPEQWVELAARPRPITLVHAAPTIVPPPQPVCLNGEVLLVMISPEMESFLASMQEVPALGQVPVLVVEHAGDIAFYDEERLVGFIRNLEPAVLERIREQIA